ncbi:MAG: hypothetical protein KME21_21030 [Desmonostoc vinosum HA7617-LM4]|jgi:hypothetical protein|nr:hypothetical protein [Desmonostoc vinosum HA7617-LM4]
MTQQQNPQPSQPIPQPGQTSAKQHEQKIQLLLAEYGLLQQRAEFARQSRDTRVSWYTAIIGGTVAGLSLFFGQNSTGKTNSLIEFRF